MVLILQIFITILLSVIAFFIFGGIVASIGYEGAIVFTAIIFFILFIIIINLLIKIKNHLEKLNQ